MGREQFDFQKAAIKAEQPSQTFSFTKYNLYSTPY